MRRLLLTLLYLLLLATYVTLRYQAVAHVEPRAFPDTRAYMRVSTRSLASAEMWLAGRPFITPLVYKAVRADPRTATAVQWLVSVVAWGMLAVVAALQVQSPMLRPLALASLLAFGSTRVVAQWDGVLLSESLALSMTALFVAGGLALATRVTARRALLVCAAGAALVFTRYVYGYLFVMLAGVVAASVPLVGRRRLRIVAIAGFFAAIGLAGVFLGQAGDRWVFASLNVLTQRILPHDHRLAYFAARGMPVDAALLRLSGQWAPSENRALLVDPELEDFRRWWKVHGKATYAGLLLSHPGYLLMGPFRDGSLLLSPSLAGYGPHGFTDVLGGALDRVIYPRAPTAVYAWGAVVVILALVAIGRGGRPEAPWLVPAMLLLSAVPFAVVIWHADAMELGRHALPVGVHVRLGLLLLFWLAVDRLLETRRDSETEPRTSEASG